jgi:hypothetical protein
MAMKSLLTVQEDVLVTTVSMLGMLQSTELEWSWWRQSFPQTGESFLHTVPSSCAAFFLFPSWPYHSIIEKDRRSHLRSSNFGIDTYRDISSGFSQQGLTSIKIQFFPSSWCCMANAPSHEESSTWKCIRRTYDWGK